MSKSGRRQRILRGLQLVVVLFGCLMSTGCTREIVGMVDGIDFERLLFGSGATPAAPAINEMISVSVGLARFAGGTFLGLMGIWCFYKAVTGQPWLDILRRSFLGAAFFGYIVTFSGGSLGLERLIYRAGTGIAQKYASKEPLAEVVLQWSESLTSPAIDASDALKELTKGQVLTAGARLIESVLKFMSEPYFAALTWVNLMGVWIIKIIVHSVFGFWFALHMILLPLVALTLLYPPLHPIFKNFMKSFCALGLVPMLFTIFERLVTVAPMATFAGRGAGATLASQSVMLRFFAGQIAVFIIDIMFLGVMGGSIAFAYCLMFGAIRLPKIGIVGT